MINKIVSAWLILKDGDSKGRVALQKRSIREKKFPHICQATWSGKIEVGETKEKALERECIEELGEKFFKNINFSQLKKIPESSNTRDGITWNCYNYLAEVNCDLISCAKIHEDALVDFVFVDSKNKIYPISSGKDPDKNIVLFDDQYEVLKNILSGDIR